MEFNHKPVLLDECLEGLDIKENGTYIDGTLGGAGHSSEILRRLGSSGLLLGLDQDAFALQVSRCRLEQLKAKGSFILKNSNFRYMGEVCSELDITEVDGILLDLGVSSHQLDEPERGFSYQHNAPLDMRMDRSRKLSARQIVNESDENELFRIIKDYGEEKWAKRIAAFIVRARRDKPLETTFELVEVIKSAIPSAARREGPHPAKRTFQAIRIAVNDELGILEETVNQAVKLLKTGGRLCIITFHSLEDRIIKAAFQQKANPCTCPPSFPVCVCGKTAEVRLVNRKPVIAGERELEENPRSRSAKLRIAEKL